LNITFFGYYGSTKSGFASDLNYHWISLDIKDALASAIQKHIKNVAPENFVIF